MTEVTAATTIRFWSPYNVDYANAIYSMEVKAPEEGNTERRSRNQSVARTRAGTTYIYDRGNNFNTQLKLDFRDIPDSERAQLIVFLEAIQWATTKVKYVDMYGVEYIVRILNEDGLECVDKGTNVKRGRSFIRWDFNLELLNLTDNIGELETVDPVPTNALLLHMQNYAEPHNPEVCTTIDAADGVIILESFSTQEWRAIIWQVTVKKGTATGIYLICSTHNRADLDTDATTTEMTVDEAAQVGDVTSNIVFTTTITGADDAQIMSLNIDVTSDDWIVCVRRIKLGAEDNMYAS